MLALLQSRSTPVVVSSSYHDPDPIYDSDLDYEQAQYEQAQYEEERIEFPIEYPVPQYTDLFKVANDLFLKVHTGKKNGVYFNTASGDRQYISKHIETMLVLCAECVRVYTGKKGCYYIRNNEKNTKMYLTPFLTKTKTTEDDKKHPYRRGGGGGGSQSQVLVFHIRGGVCRAMVCH